MIATSFNFHIDEAVNLFVHELEITDDLYTLKIAEYEGSYPVATIFLSLADLHRFRNTLDKYLSALPAEGEVDSERKEAVHVAEDSQLEP